MVDDGAALRFHLERFDDFLTLEQGTSPRTVEAYRRDIERLVEYAVVKGIARPNDLTSRTLREFVYHLKDLGLAPASIPSAPQPTRWPCSVCRSPSHFSPRRW